MKRLLPLAVISMLVLALAITAGRSETHLVLIDGQILSGVDVRRDESVYLLEQANGTVMTIPVEFVKEVRLLGDEKEDGFDPVTGLVYDKTQILAGEEPPDPGGVVTTGPQTLAGEPVDPVTPGEATAVFGEPAKFANDVIDPEWRPESDWDMDPRKNNNFAPSKWADNVIDPDWSPSSDWSNDTKQNDFAPSTWSESVIDSSWQPTDGFKGS